MLNAFTAEALVDHTAVLVAAKVIPDRGPMVKLVDPFPAYIEGIDPSPKTKEPIIAKVVISNEYKEILAKAKIETDVDDRLAVESPAAVDPNGSVRKGGPTDVSVGFSVAPANPGRSPSVIRHPKP